ncbi:MAG: IS1595 family transposase, partial [Candidatus Pacebacteria bacterium]|nr:IS1595 family transposase [Candidatus Paceibacterota bacterium]
MKLQIWHGKISGYKTGKTLHHFIVDVEASKTAQLIGLNRKTVDKYYGLFRQLIYQERTTEFEKL